jgi:enoyl-CoA hydratase
MVTERNAGIAMETVSAPNIQIAKDRSVAIVTLDRPRALNALTIEMREKMFRAFPDFARDPVIYAVVQRSTSPRAFSAGSDVREIIGLAKTDMTAAKKAFRDEYALNWQIECFSKPTVSLIDGMVMGGGVGISAYGTHRVAGESYRWAMPETMIGLFPDVGACYLLARMPGSMGVYLGLTGNGISRADAYALGLATHCIGAQEHNAITEALADVWPVDTILDERHRDPGARELEPQLETISQCFSAHSVEEILDRLAAVKGANAQWAQKVLEDLKKRSPVSLKITLRHIMNAKELDLRQTLLSDYRLAVRCLEGHDFREGARAVLIEKSNDARWKPSRIEDVSDDMIAGYFSPLGAEELILPTRQEMQAARA